jgi:hypothetical protein
MNSYPCKAPSRQLSLSCQPEDFYGGQLFWHFIAIVLLAAITVLAGLSLIGSAAGADEQTAAGADRSKQSISARPLANTKYDGRPEKWISTA